MGRPFTASDDEIMEAAQRVISRRGLDGFSVQEVADEVGLSRAAVALRFKSTHALKVASLRRMVHRFATLLEALPTSRSGDSLLQVAAFIGGHSESREAAVRFFANYYSSSMRDRSLLRLEQQRGEALSRAIAKVMPRCAIDRPSAIEAFSAHLTGSIVAWVGHVSSSSRRDYLVRRTAEWLTLANIPFTPSKVQELCSGAGSESTRRTSVRFSTEVGRRSKAIRH